MKFNLIYILVSICISTYASQKRWPIADSKVVNPKCATIASSGPPIDNGGTHVVNPTPPQKVRNTQYQILQMYPADVSVIKEYIAPGITQDEFEQIIQSAPYPDEPINHLIKHVATIPWRTGDEMHWSDISEKRYSYLRILFSKYEKYKPGGWYAFDLVKSIKGQKYYIFNGTKPNTALVIFPNGGLYRGKIGDIENGWPEYYELALRRIETDKL